MGKAFEKQIKTIEDQERKQVEAFKTKSVEGKSNDSKEIYDKVLEERMDEILEMSREINYSNLVYNFKGQTPSKFCRIWRSNVYLWWIKKGW